MQRKPLLLSTSQTRIHSLVNRLSVNPHRAPSPVRVTHWFLVVALLLALWPAQVQAQSNNQRYFALAAPFPTVTDDLSFAALKAHWQGDTAGLGGYYPNTKLFVLRADLDALKPILGNNGNTVQVIDGGYTNVVVSAWAARPGALALIPFDQLETRWKVIHIDGVNLFDKQANVGGYPLKVAGEANRDPNKMTVVAMTGVTALVRGTAVMMEKKGITYPGEAIRDWLLSADITHISNEVSFWDKCPKPTFNDGTTMCSSPRYLELLKYVGTDVIDLTGNHLWDRGSENLSTTLKIYEDLGWPYFGGGRTAQTALDPVKLTVQGNKIAFIGCNWFGSDWATDTKPGSARCGSKSPRNLDLITAGIKKLVGEGYLVIATLQYLELYDYVASPQQVRDFDAVRAAGALVVNGSQGHNVQGFDVNDKGFIHYGTGNLFFGDQAGVGTHQTFVDRHVFYNGKYLGVDLRSAYIRDNAQPQPMTEAERSKILRTLFKASGY